MNSLSQILGEIWEQKENKKHMFEIECMLEMHGLCYISTPRHDNKRGGGAGLVINSEKYFIEKIEAYNPKKIETVFALLRPKEPTSIYKKNNTLLILLQSQIKEKICYN